MEKSVMNTTTATTRDEIFVDIIEKINVTFNSSGNLVTSEINGHIQVRNFLMGEDTKVKLALSDDLTIGGKGTGVGGGYMTAISTKTPIWITSISIARSPCARPKASFL